MRNNKAVGNAVTFLKRDSQGFPVDILEKRLGQTPTSLLKIAITVGYFFFPDVGNLVSIMMQELKIHEYIVQYGRQHAVMESREETPDE